MPLFTSGGPALRGTILFRQALGVVGVLLALLGVGLGNRWVIWTAMAVLGASIVLRLVSSRTAKRD